MSKDARQQILTGMRRALTKTPPPATKTDLESSWNQRERIEILKKHLEAARSEVILTSQEEKLQTLEKLIAQKKIDSLLYSPQVELGQELLKDTDFEKDGVLRTYSGDEVTDKQLLFEVDASVTTARGAIAENGAIILWPDENEPRMMSLVPPIHIVVLAANQIFSSFDQAIREGGWTAGMPTNAVLISGPSRTADIELVLAFGVHGPKEVVVVIAE